MHIPYPFFGFLCVYIAIGFLTEWQKFSREQHWSFELEVNMREYEEEQQYRAAYRRLIAPSRTPGRRNGQDGGQA